MWQRRKAAFIHMEWRVETAVTLAVPYASNLQDPAQLGCMADWRLQMLTRWLSLLIAAVALLAAHLPAQARIWDSVPDEQLQALQLSREASP